MRAETETDAVLADRIEYGCGCPYLNDEPACPDHGSPVAWRPLPCPCHVVDAVPPEHDAGGGI